MKAFITCINGIAGTTRVAQEMISNIAHQLGFRTMGIFHYDASTEREESISARYDGIIAGISGGDIVVFQYPTWNHMRFEEGLINRIKAYGGRVVIMLHDVEPLMFESSRWMLGRVVDLFNWAEVLVVPSYAMKSFLQENGIRENMKFVIQELFDYVTDIQVPQLPKFQKVIHLAGNPSKFLPMKQWDYDVSLKVYTTEEYTGDKVQIMGWIDPSNLLLELSKGGFGLVWGGWEYWQQYMKYNNPFKLNTYLAAGIPVIVPSWISNRYLIEQNHLGLVADTLDEAVERVRSMEEAEYQDYARHVASFAPLIRGGYFTKKFLIDAVHMVLREDMAALPMMDEA